MNNKKTELAQFYSAYAKSFSRTRKKHRPEIDLIIQDIQKTPAKIIHILDLGCGDGRLLTYLKKNCDKKIQYTGVDIAQGLIDIAKQTHKTGKFICKDMTEFLQKQKQEQYDYVVSIAAFQHIPSTNERHYVMKLIYRTLTYSGRLAMTNRSRSTRFIQKYRKAIIQGIGRSLFSHTNQRNDVYIARKSPTEIHKRYYHIFTKKELAFLTQDAGFSIQKLVFSHKTGGITNQRKNAKNTILIAQKTTYDHL